MATQNKTEHATILVVDDNPETLKFIVNYLSSYGFTVLPSNSGQYALDLLGHHNPDLILLDIVMPGIDGFETCRQLKAREATKDIPVIFLSILSDPTDKITAFDVGAIDFITKPFEREELVARIKAHLAVVRQQKHLQQQIDSLQHINTGKDTFFGIIAHDLQSPLGVLREVTQLALDDLENFSLKKFKEIFTLQQNSIDSLCKLLENLLTWSRLQRGMIDYLPQHIDMAVVAANNIGLLFPIAHKKQITLKNSVPQETMAYADNNMVDTILRNLISNALKFTHTNGAIEVLALSQDHYVEVAVADNGVGIAAEHLPKLFALGKRYKRLGTAREKGTGLGLILCKDFVEKNGGTIWAESEVGKGTAFKFTLPKEPKS